MSATQAPGAAAKTPPPPPEWVARLNDKNRIPKARTAMLLLIPAKNGKDSRVTVLELKDGVRLELEVDGIARSVDLALSEAAALSDMLSRIRVKVAKRASWRP